MFPAMKVGGFATMLLVAAHIVKLSLNLSDGSEASTVQQSHEIVNSTIKVLTRKVAHIKLHKVGSTTLSNIVRRQCDNGGLRCALAKPGSSWFFEGLRDLQWKASKYPEGFDVHSVHSVFDPASLEIMSPGVFKFASFRRPLSRVLSGLRDALLVLRRVPAAASVSAKEIETLDCLIHGSEHSCLSNWLMGPVSCGGFAVLTSALVPTSMFHMLDFIVLVEKFDLSLLLLRRVIGLDVKDMLYLRCRSTTRRHLRHFPDVESLYFQFEELMQENATRGAMQQAYYDTCIGGEEEELYNLAQERFRRQWDQLAAAEQTEVENELVAFQKALAVLSKCCRAYPFDVYCGALGERDNEYFPRHQWRVVSPVLPFPIEHDGTRLDVWSQTSECMNRAFATLDGNESRVD